MTYDVEKGAAQLTYTKGYPSLADFIASDFDRSTFIFKRFNRLSARNLLHLQSEIAELEALQHQYDREDLMSKFDEKLGRRDWKTFVERAGDIGYPNDQARMKLARDIRVKLREYKEALVLDSTLLSIPQPSTQVYTAFKNHFWNENNSNGRFPTLLGNSSGTYDTRDDLISLARPVEEDRLSRFLRRHCSILFLSRKQQQKGSLAYISGGRIKLVAGILNILLAAILLFGAILNLSYVVDQKKRLGLITGYSAIFAFCVGLLTNARRAEIFGACSAYAAVLVVFIGGNNGC